jgi:hypothetical protein
VSDVAVWNRRGVLGRVVKDKKRIREEIAEGSKREEKEEKNRTEKKRKEKKRKVKKRKEKDLKAEHDAATAMAILYYALSALFYYLRARHQRCFHIAF